MPEITLVSSIPKNSQLIQILSANLHPHAGRPQVQLNTPLAPVPTNVKREAVVYDPLAIAQKVDTDDTPEDYVTRVSRATPPPPPADLVTSIFGTVEDLTSIFQSDCSRQPLDPKGVSKNLGGMILLAKANMWRAVLETSSMFPFDPSNLKNKQAVDPDTMSALSLRFEALFRLKMFDELSSEAGKVISQLALLEDAVDESSLG